MTRYRSRGYIQVKTGHNLLTLGTTYSKKSIHPILTDEVVSLWFSRWWPCELAKGRHRWQWWIKCSWNIWSTNTLTALLQSINPFYRIVFQFASLLPTHRITTNCHWLWCSCMSTRTLLRNKTLQMNLFQSNIVLELCNSASIIHAINKCFYW